MGTVKSQQPEHLGPYLLGPNDTEENGIYIGDARELAGAIPDESVDLIFTDPVYDRIDDYRWLARMAARTGRSDSTVLVFVANERILDVGAAMDCLRFRRIMTIFHAGVTVGNYIGKIFSKTTSCLAFWQNGGGPKKTIWDISIGVSNKEKYGQYHTWGKDPQAIARWIDAFCINGIVLDPFTGGGTVPAVCKMLRRRYLAFEIDPETAKLARERVRDTQPPLFVPQPQQLVMDMA